jgi:hypothetical protein
MAQDNEITALKASGINVFRVVLAPLAGAFALFLGLCWFNGWILPESNHRLASLMVDVSQKRPTVRLVEGVFINDFPGYSLLVRRVIGTTNEMRGVTLFEFGANPSPNIIVAESGTLTYLPDGDTALLELHDGVLHEVPGDTPGARKYRRLKFDVHRIFVPGAGTMLRRSVRDMRSDREMTLAQLKREIGVADEQLEAAKERAADIMQQTGTTSLTWSRAPTVPARRALARSASRSRSCAGSAPISPSCRPDPLELQMDRLSSRRSPAGAPRSRSSCRRSSRSRSPASCSCSSACRSACRSGAAESRSGSCRSCSSRFTICACSSASRSPTAC